MKQSNRKCRGYWTKEKCQIESLKYKKRSEFKSGSGGAYNFAKDNKFLDEICSHMKIIGNRFKRLVYVYEFSDKNVYIGLTHNIDERDNKHKRDLDSSVYNHIKNTGLFPNLSYTKYMPAYEAQKLEKETLENYKINGYIILNKAKTGALGGENIKWTFEKCFLEAKNCESRTEFSKKNESAYNASRRYGWIDDVCSHMPILNKKSKNYWTKDKCKKEANKFKKRNIFYKKSPGAYMACLKNKWLDDVCKHMNSKNKKPNGYWTKERCYKEAKNYNLKSKFHLYSGGAYCSARKNGWLDEICSHMKKYL